MNKKTYFEAPSAELIVVRFEENFCGTTFGTSNIEIPDEEDADL